MKIFEPVAPAGMLPVREMVRTICDQARMYRYSGIVPEPLMIQVDAGNGRTFLTQYITDMFRSHRVLGFTSGRDAFLELVLDGTLPQLRSAMETIHDAAEYDNVYREVIALHITSLASHLKELQAEEFLDSMVRICSHAFVIFYVSHTPGAREEQLIERLQDRIPKVHRIATEEYTVGELAEITLRMIAEHGIEIDSRDCLQEMVARSLSELEGPKIPDARDTALRLLRCADYSPFTPVIRADIVSEKKVLTEGGDNYGKK